MAAPKKPAALPPIPAKYAQMPPDVARAMMASDKNNLLAKGQKALSAGTVKDTGAGIQSGGARAAAASAAAAAVEKRNAADNAGLNAALKGGIGGGRRGRQRQINSILGRMK